MNMNGKKTSDYTIELLGGKSDHYLQLLHTSQAYFPNAVLKEKPKSSMRRKKKKHQLETQELHNTEDTATGTCEEREEVNQQQECVDLKHQGTSPEVGTDGTFKEVNQQTESIDKKHQGTSAYVQTKEASTGSCEGHEDVNQQTNSVATHSQGTSTVESTDDDCQTVSPDMVDQCWQTDSPVSVGQMCESIDTTQNSTQDPEGREDKDLQTDKLSEQTVSLQADFIIDRKVTKVNENNPLNPVLPPRWVKLDSEDRDQLLIIGVGEHTDDFKKIWKLFKSSWPKRGTEIKYFYLERIQNQHLWDEYCWRKQQLERQRSRKHDGTKVPRQLTEKQLFHGTSEGVVRLIMKQSFDMRLNGKNATHHGKGAYFSRRSHYSHDFTDKMVKKFIKEGKTVKVRESKMFVARVLVGDYNVGKPNTLRPDWDEELGKFNEGCVNDMKDPSQFIIFSNDQVYPEYLITYQF